MKHIAMLALSALALCAQAQTDYSKIEIRTYGEAGDHYIATQLQVVLRALQLQSRVGE